MEGMFTVGRGKFTQPRNLTSIIALISSGRDRPAVASECRGVLVAATDLTNSAKSFRGAMDERRLWRFSSIDLSEICNLFFSSTCQYVAWSLPWNTVKLMIFVSSYPMAVWVVGSAERNAPVITVASEHGDVDLSQEPNNAYRVCWLDPNPWPVAERHAFAWCCPFRWHFWWFRSDQRPEHLKLDDLNPSFKN